MRQQEFEQAHGAVWQQFDELLRVLEDRGRADAGLALHRFPRMLRQISGHYALARSRGYSPGLTRELHRLVRGGYGQLYRPRAGWSRQVAHHLVAGFPCALRRHAGLFWLACLAFFGPMVAMGVGCAGDDALIHSLLAPDQVAGYESMYDPTNARPGRSADRQADDDLLMFGYYVRNNVGIALRTFAWGVLLGVGSLFVLTVNGLFTGAVAGHLTQLGYGTPFWSFVSGHSALELTAIVVAGTAGLLLGQAVLAPGRRGRAEALRGNAPEALLLVGGAVVMLLLAAVVEAFWSSSAAIDPIVKYAVGVAGWVLVATYLGLGGRGLRDGS